MLETRSSERLTAMRLTVANHPGVLSHICSLLARRYLKLPSLLAAPAEDGRALNVWLAVDESDHLEQMVKQLRKLHDVWELKLTSLPIDAFARLSHSFSGE